MLTSMHKIIVVLYGGKLPKGQSVHLLDKVASLERLVSKDAACKANSAVALTTDKVEGFVSGKLYKWPGATEKIEKLSEAGLLKRISLQYIPEEAKAVAFDWGTTAECGSYGKGNVNYCQVGIDSNALSSAGPNQLLKMAQSIVESGSYQYGFIVSMERAMLPSGYAIGLPGKGEDYFLRESNRWSAGRDKFYDRKLRGVYPVNFLTSAHLNEALSSGQSLKQWIEKASHGTLSPWAVRSSEEMYLWRPLGDKWSICMDYGLKELAAMRSELMSLGGLCYTQGL